MKSIKQEFPNPVLAAGNNDYTDSCHFYTTFEESDIVVDSENIVIPIKYSLSCNGIQRLVDEENAIVVVSIKSSAASFSELYIFKQNETSMEIRIPKYSVAKRMELEGSVIANNRIEKFECPGEFNELFFQSSTFEIRKGDILAIEDSRTIYVDDTELEKPISSIFNISRRQNEFDDVEPDFYDEKIEIFLNEKLYNLYYKFKDFNNGSLRRYVTGIIVYPVLVEAITMICGYYQSDGDGIDSGINTKRWFRAIEKKAEKLNIDMSNYRDSCVSLANKLLGEIALDALQGFMDTLDSEMNSGETLTIGGMD